jgi:hypothetical protein
LNCTATPATVSRNTTKKQRVYDYSPMRSLVILLILSISLVCKALYSSNSDVVQVTDKNFKQEVLQHPGVVIVEFYAPWYVVFFSSYCVRKINLKNYSKR